jgi:folate-binding protein YgfZ
VRLVIDRSSWGRLRVTGADRTRFLQGLTTVNVEKLADGAHAWGAILSPKGRVLSVIDVTRTPGGDAYVVASEASIAAATRALLERYAVMDDVAFEPLTGPAHQIWDDPATAWDAPIVEGAGGGVSEVAGEVARPETDPDVERLRIRAGFLRYGVDVGEDRFPFETPLARFLDYGKGCYVGQEPVFRVHAQGNAAYALRGLLIEGPSPVAPGTKLDAPAKGEVTSSVVDGDAVRALAYLHRTCWEPGATLAVAGRRAAVHELPW